MFHGAIQKIKVASYFLEHGVHTTHTHALLAAAAAAAAAAVV